MTTTTTTTSKQTIDTTTGTAAPVATTAAGNLGPGPKPVMTPTIRWLLDVMREFALDKLSPLIAFKLAGDQQQASDSASETKEVPTRLCSSMVQTAAFLVSKGILDLKELVLQYCSPKLPTETEEAYKAAWQLKKFEIESLSKMSKSADPPGSSNRGNNSVAV